MILSDKFESSEIFLAYAKMVSGYTFDETAINKWYTDNPDFYLTYTGIVNELKPMITGVAISAKQNQ